jgi:hypothetical protein
MVTRIVKCNKQEAKDKNRVELKKLTSQRINTKVQYTHCKETLYRYRIQYMTACITPQLEPGAHTFSKNLGATSKLLVPGE